MRSLGFTAEHDFNHVPRGHNYRLANALAALILQSLHRIDENLQRRAAIAEQYDRLLPTEWRMPKRDVTWVYDLRIPDLSLERQREIVRGLNNAGIAARHAFKPMSRQPEYLATGNVSNPNAQRLAQEVLYLPVDPKMSAADVQTNVDTLLRIATAR